MKVKLTRKWKKLTASKTSVAGTDIGTLWCNDISWCSMYSPSWQGRAVIGSYQRVGPTRRSEVKARMDAEKLITELLRDIRDGSRELMNKCGMGEDD